MEFVTIDVPVVSCEPNSDNILAPVWGTTSITVIKGTQDLARKQFQEMAKIRENLCTARAEDHECYVLLPAEPYDELHVPTQLVVRFGLNYPASTGSKWDIHLPSPIPGLNWCEHFEPLTRTVVDQNSELRFCGRQYWGNSKVWTGGYFASEEEASTFLDQVTALSLATPGKRTITKRVKPNGLPPEEAVRNVRAVRAVVSNISYSLGKPVITDIECYAPPEGGC